MQIKSQTFEIIMLYFKFARKYKMATLPREITPRILEALRVSPIVYLNGARQAGKSTLVQELTGKIGIDGTPARYVTFDRPTQMAAAVAAPEAFLTADNNTLIIDEVQMVPELFRTLKIVADELRIKAGASANGRFLLTGSANILALPKLSDALVGRMSVLTLYPFSTAETIAGSERNGLQRLLHCDFSGLANSGISIFDAVRRASFPELLHKNENEAGIWFDGYITMLLQRDVRQFADLEKTHLLPHLLQLLALRAGSLLNDSDLARDLGMNSVTGKSYRNILKMMFLNFDVQPWYRNVGKRIVKAPKNYMTDTLLLCHILDWRLPDLASKRPELFGKVLENFVATELTKQLSYVPERAQLLHFRTSDGKEVDFILEKPDGSVVAIEVKSTESVTGNDFKGIYAFAELAGTDFVGGVVLYSGKEVVPFGKHLWAVPYSVLWQ